MTWYYIDREAFSYALLSILFEGIPFLLLGSIISGLVDVYVSSERVAKLMPKSAVGSVFLAGVMGFVFPICECGSVVVVRRFIRKGLPLGAAVAYMLAAPIVSPIVAISTFKAFSSGIVGGQEVSAVMFTLMRLGMGFSIAVLIALVIQRLPASKILQPGLLTNPDLRRTGLRITGEGADFATLVSQASPGRKLLLAVQSAASDFLDVAFYFVIGASLASLFIGFKEASIEPLATSPFLSIVALMLLAAILCLCSTTDAFVAANAFMKFPLAANLGFLVFGPMFDAKLFWLYGMIFKRRFVAVLGLAMFALIGFVCWQIGRVDTWRPPAKAALATPANPLPSTP